MAQIEETYKHEIGGKTIVVEYSGNIPLSEHNKDAAREMIVDAIANGISKETYAWNHFNQLIVWSIQP